MTLKGGQLLVKPNGRVFLGERKRKSKSKSKKEHILFCEFPQATTRPAGEITKGKQELPVLQVRRPLPGLHDSVGRNWVGTTLSPVAELGERPTERRVPEKTAPALATTLVLEEVNITRHASGRRCPGPKSHSLTATFHLRQLGLIMSQMSCTLSLITSLTMWSPRLPNLPSSLSFSS